MNGNGARKTGNRQRASYTVPRVVALAIVALVLAFGAGLPPITAQERQEAYRIGAGDKLDITVFGHDDLSTEVLVDGSGRIALPLLGQVDAGGKTIAELQTHITEALDRDFIVEPRVSIGVVNYRPFYILGQVNKPGSYSYVEGMTVRMAVALAGGFTRRAHEDNVVIIRAKDPEREAVEAELDARLFPGDTIEVERRLF